MQGKQWKSSEVGVQAALVVECQKAGELRKLKLYLDLMAQRAPV